MILLIVIRVDSVYPEHVTDIAGGNSCGICRSVRFFVYDFGGSIFFHKLVNNVTGSHCFVGRAAFVINREFDRSANVKIFFGLCLVNFAVLYRSFRAAEYADAKYNSQRKERSSQNHGKFDVLFFHVLTSFLSRLQ